MLLNLQLRLLDYVIRMPDGRPPHHVPYGQLKRCPRSVGEQKKRFKYHIKSILEKYNILINRLDALSPNRATGRSICAFKMPYFDAEYDRAAALRRSRRHQHAAAPTTRYRSPVSTLWHTVKHTQWQWQWQPH